jgi:magnesium-transporting ATPase (P-type)
MIRVPSKISAIRNTYCYPRFTSLLRLGSYFRCKESTDGGIIDIENMTEEVVNRMDMFPFHASTKEECFKHLGVSNTTTHHRSGLTDSEAAERLNRYGPNKLTEKTKVTIWQRIWHQVANVLVGILVVVAVVSAAQAIRFATVEPNQQNVITNSIQVALIAFVIMYEI